MATLDEILEEALQLKPGVAPVGATSQQSIGDIFDQAISAAPVAAQAAQAPPAPPPPPPSEIPTPPPPAEAPPPPQQAVSVGQMTIQAGRGEEQAIESLAKTVENIADRTAKTFVRSLEVSGLGFGEEAEEFFAPVIGKQAPPVLRTFNRVLLEGPVEVLDISMAAFQGGLAGLAAIAEQAGISTTTTKQLIRDVNGMVIQSMSRGGAATAPRRAVVSEEIVQKATKDLPTTPISPSVIAKRQVDAIELRPSVTNISELTGEIQKLLPPEWTVRQSPVVETAVMIMAPDGAAIGALRIDQFGNARSIVKQAITDEAIRNPQPMVSQKQVATVALKEIVDPLTGLNSAIAAPGFRKIADQTSLGVVDRMTASVFDRLLPLKRVGEELNDVVPYEEMRLLAGTREVIRSVIEHGTIKFAGNGDIIFSGEGLHQVLNPILPKADLFAAYAVARRSGELIRTGKETLVSKEQIKAGLELGKQNPEFRTTFEAYQRYNKRMLDFAQQSGLLNAKSRKAISEANMNYVPFYRVDIGKPGLLRRVTGRKEQLKDVFENMVLNTATMVEAGLKNKAKQQVYEQLDTAGLIGKEGSGKAIERLGPKQEFVKLIDADLVPQLREIGVEADAQLFRALSFRKNLGPTTDGIMVNGKWTFFKINDPTLLAAINAYEPTAFPTSVRMLGAFPKLMLTRLVTMDPGFIITNAIRDTQSAYINTRGGFIPGIGSIRGLANRILQQDEYWEFLANGGGISTLFKSELETARGMRDFYKGHGINYRNVLDTPAKIARTIEDVTGGFETAARFEEARLTKNRLTAQGTVEAPTPRARRQAAFAGREVSVDFAKMGSSKTVQFFTTTAPFFNAGLQGLLRLGEVIKENPVRTAAKGGVITLASLMLYAENKDQDWYKATPDWVKDNHWLVRLPGADTTLLIPKGFEYGAIFATVPERMFEGVEQQYGKRFTDKMLEIVAMQLRLDPTPQLAKVALEQVTNKTFTGAPVVPESMIKNLPSEQVRPWTSETIVELSKFLKEDAGLEMSPLRTEALMRSIFGTLGTYILEGVDAATRVYTGKEPPTPRIDETPVLKRFFRQDPQRRTQQEIDFFELLHATRQTVGSYANIVKQVRELPLDQREEALFGLRRSAAAVARVSGQLSEQLSRVLLSDMTPKEKAEERDKIYKARNELFDSFMTAVPEEILREEGLQVP